MRKLIALTPVILMAAVACNKKSTDSSAAPTDTTATPTATNTTTSLVQRALSFVSGSPFEGEITMSMAHSGKPPTVVLYTVKAPKMRFSVPTPRGGQGYAIFDPSTKKMMTVMDDQKTVMVMDMNAVGGASGVAAAAQKSVVDKTGKTDTVAGYTCDVWKVTETSGDKVDLCVAQGIEFPRMMGLENAGWMGELGGGFPLRAVTTDASGKEKGRMEVTKIDKKSIDDAQFQVPPGYKTMDMSAMLGGLGGLRHP